MRTALVISLIVSSLIAATGCSVSTQTTRHSAIDASSDPAFTPPGQMNIAISDNARAGSAKTTAEATPMQPNKREIQKHSIRAAASMY